MMENEIMTKEELSELLHTLGIPVSEGITAERDVNKYPRVVYWPFAEQDIVSSGEGYKNLVTYQISFYDRIPQSSKYKELRKLLREKGQHPFFTHEYVENDPIYSKTWHTYFALDILEEIPDED